LTKIARALSDQSRVRALLALKNHQLCVCQIMELLGFAPSTVSKHMSILKQAGLVESRKEGRWVYYRLAGASAPAVVLETISWVTGLLQSSEQISQDSSRIEEIVRMDPAALFQRSPNQHKEEK